MKRRVKRCTAAILLVLMLLLLSACGGRGTDTGSQIPESTKGKVLQSSVSVDDVFSLNCNHNYSFNPLIATNHSNQLVVSLVYENLVELDNNFEVHANVITEWSCNEDGTNWTFKVDTGRTFHDGTNVSARDLRYSIERAIVSDRYSGRFASYQGAGTDKDTLYITLGIGDTDFIRLLNLPLIKYGTYDEKYPTGSGPYTYNEDFTALEPYEPYYEHLNELAQAAAEESGEEPELAEPPVDAVYLTDFSTMDTILEAFENGGVDLVINDPSSATNIGYASTNEIHTYATTNLHYIGFNVSKNNACADSLFRYALNYAFDRSYMVQLLNNNAIASSVAMYPSCAYYPSSLASELRYDLETCKVILANCGVDDYDDDGRMEYSSFGTEIELKLIVCSDSSAKAGVCNRFAADMANLGITINVAALSWDAYKTALEEGDFDLYYGEVRLRNNFDLTELLQVRTEDNERSNLNYSGSRDNTFETLINAYLKASSFEKSKAYASLAEYVANQSVIIPIGFEKQQMITHRGVCRGAEPNMGNPLYRFAYWKVELE